METTTFPRFPASFRARRIKAAWPACSAPIVGTKTKGRSALAQELRAEAGDSKILTVPAGKLPWQAVGLGRPLRIPAEKPDQQPLFEIYQQDGCSNSSLTVS